jgi:uncharacterized membrane-anchored protein
VLIVINKILIFVLLLCFALYLALGERGEVQLVAMGYVVETSGFLLASAVVGFIFVTRVLCWIISWPCRRMRSRELARGERLVRCADDYWISLIAGELDTAAKELAKLSEPHDFSRAVLAEELGNTEEARRNFEAIVFCDGAPKNHRLAAVKRLLAIYDSWCDANKTKVDELLHIAEKLSDSRWILDARFNFYLRNRMWHKALNMIEYSIFTKRKRRFSSELCAKAMLYCAIASEYEAMSDTDEARKYWTRAFKTDDDMFVAVMYCDFLERSGTLSLEVLNKCFAAFPHSWALAQKYLTFPGVDVKNIKSPYSALITLASQEEVSLSDLVVALEDTNNEMLIAIGKAAADSKSLLAALRCASPTFVCGNCLHTTHKCSAVCESCGQVGSQVLVG